MFSPFAVPGAWRLGAARVFSGCLGAEERRIPWRSVAARITIDEECSRLHGRCPAGGCDPSEVSVLEAFWLADRASSFAPPTL